MYAIIEDGGRQQRVSTGDRILIDREISKETKSISFDQVLLVGGDGSPKIGQPILVGATVTADVLGLAKGEKLITIKQKRRKGYHRKYGHRQHYTAVRITAINA